MTQKSVVEQAKQGDPSAIAALINSSLSSRGITAKASLKAGCLEVVLVATQVPDQHTVAPVVRKGIERLGVISIKQVRISGQASGASSHAWSEEFAIPSAAAPPGVTRPSPPPTTRQSKTLQRKQPAQSQSNQSNSLCNFLPLIGLSLLVIGFIGLFVNFVWGIAILFLGLFTCALWGVTPEGKALLKQQKAEQANRQKQEQQSIEVAREKIALLQQESDNQQLRQEIYEAIQNFSDGSLKAEMRAVVMPFLKLVALDDQLRSSISSKIKQCIQSITFSNEVVSQDVYDLALEILESHPTEPKIRQFVLDIGRWHFGKARGTGNPTVYDEQAIQNDIMVRSK